MTRIHRLFSPTAPTRLAPRAGLVVLLLLGGAFALHARKGDTPKAAEGAPLPKGTLKVRRFDADSPDGHAKAGTIDLRAASERRDNRKLAEESLASHPW